MTSDYKMCINCVGKKIQNMIPIHIYKCTPRISIGIDKKIQDVILFSMISVHFFEGSQKIALRNMIITSIIMAKENLLLNLIAVKI